MGPHSQRSSSPPLLKACGGVCIETVMHHLHHYLHLSSGHNTDQVICYNVAKKHGKPIKILQKWNLGAKNIFLSDPIQQ